MTHRVPTTPAGSLPRSAALPDFVFAADRGEPMGEASFGRWIGGAVPPPSPGRWRAAA